MEAAGSAGLIFITAWLAMVTSAEVSAGETAVVIGAVGGVGSAAVQVAKSRGARVVGVVRSDKDIPSARQNGAAEVINARSANIADAVMSITNNRGANVVFDTSGTMFAEAVEIAGMNGRIPVITAPADGKTTFNLRSLYRKTQRIFGIDTRQLDSVFSAKLLSLMASEFASGRFTANPGQSYPLAAVVAAYEQAARGGRIILRPDL
jgi:NADPH:quinone reductase-like Zn-dependent oxidoreductase